MNPRWLRITLCSAMAVAGIALCWSAYLRSLIPQEVSGTVVATRVVGGTTGKVTLVQIGETWIEADTNAVRGVGWGDLVHKDAWADHLEVNGGRRALRASPEVFQLVLLTPLAVGAVWLLTRPRPAEGTP